MRVVTFDVRLRPLRVVNEQRGAADTEEVVGMSSGDSSHRSIPATRYDQVLQVG